jgi:hypothetical protein
LFVVGSASVVSVGATAGGHHGGLDLDAHDRVGRYSELLL